MSPNSALYDSRHIDYFYENINDSEDAIEDAFKSIGVPDYEGWLKKQGDKYKTWKSRYCILKGVNLYYFKNDKVLIIFVPLKKNTFHYIILIFYFLSLLGT